MNRTELLAERNMRLDRSNVDRERIAAIDAQLARLARPEGWTGADTPPPDAVSVLVASNLDAISDPARGGVGIAFYDHTFDKCWKWPAPWEGFNIGEVLYWCPLPADGLSPPAKSAKYPRYFRRIGGHDDANRAYLRVDAHDSGEWVRKDGDTKGCPVSIRGIDRCVADGTWLEITAAEAEAMVKPKGGTPSRVGESTNTDTCLLVEGVEFARDSEGGKYLHPAMWHKVIDRILAADRSGLWELIADRHKHGHHYPTKFRRSDGTEYCAVAYWDRDILRWVTADTDLVSDDDAVAVLDPSRLIGGGK